MTAVRDQLLGPLLLAPLIVGSFGMIIERTMLRGLYNLDHLYGCCLLSVSR